MTSISLDELRKLSVKWSTMADNLEQRATRLLDGIEGIRLPGVIGLEVAEMRGKAKGIRLCVEEIQSALKRR